MRAPGFALEPATVSLPFYVVVVASVFCLTESRVGALASLSHSPRACFGCPAGRKPLAFVLMSCLLNENMLDCPDAIPEHAREP